MPADKHLQTDGDVGRAIPAELSHLTDSVERLQLSYETASGERTHVQQQEHGKSTTWWGARP